MRIIDNTPLGATLLLENAGDCAMLLTIFDYWQRRWSPREDFILQAIPKDVMDNLNAAWLEATRKECE